MHDLRTRQEFYQAHLDRVSRSFAFCIARLDSPLRERVALGYLLCRIVDTVEDAGWTDFKEQQRAFERFDGFLRSPPLREEVANWRADFPNVSVSEGESLLLDDAWIIFSDFHALAHKERDVLLRPILSMSAGMRHFMKRRAGEGELRLRSASDVNRYCFFVAGVVGEMLSGFVDHDAGEPPTDIKDAFRFGLFLQKINLLKDQLGDEKQGRFLVPSRELLRESLARDADVAFRYFKNLPDHDEGFRVFCAWSLFLGLASLPWIEKSLGSVENAKLPREEASLLLTAIEDGISDHAMLEDLFRDLKPPLGPAEVSRVAIGEQDEEDELLALYSGRLQAQEVLDLFRGV